jgi:hypothetical protein
MNIFTGGDQMKVGASRLARVAALTAAVWPLAVSGGGPQKTERSLIESLAVARCQASSFPPVVTPNGLSYDANTVRCVIGGDGCETRYR